MALNRFLDKSRVQEERWEWTWCLEPEELNM